jgi:DNA-binding transcriptional LysR family regulator
MLAASRKAGEIVDRFRQGRSSVIRVGGTPFFTDGLISTMIAEFQNAYPDIRVDQSYGYLPELRAALEADRIDLAIAPIDILDEGSGLTFEEILPGRNIVACRSTHPLLMHRRLNTSGLLDYPWIAPPPGSPLLADMRTMMLSLGATEIKIRYTGGSLASTMNYMKATDALTVLPHSVVFAFRKEGAITHCRSSCRIQTGRSACCAPPMRRTSPPSTVSRRISARASPICATSSSGMRRPSSGAAEAGSPVVPYVRGFRLRTPWKATRRFSASCLLLRTRRTSFQAI